MDFKEKLNLFFKEMRKKGYFAKQKFQCCQTCGWSAIPKEKKDKAVFYHEQDAENLEKNFDEIYREIRNGLKAYWVHMDYCIDYHFCRSLVNRIGRDD